MYLSVLQEASRKGRLAVEDALRHLQRERPELFHNDASLAERVFYDEPVMGEPYRKFIRPAVPRLNP